MFVRIPKKSLRITSIETGLTRYAVNKILKEVSTSNPGNLSMCRNFSQTIAIVAWYVQKVSSSGAMNGLNC